MKRVNSCCTDTIVGLFINYQVHRRKFCCCCLYFTQPEISRPSYKHACITWTKADSTAYWDIRARIPVYFESTLPPSWFSSTSINLTNFVPYKCRLCYNRWFNLQHTITSKFTYETVSSILWLRAVYCPMQPLSINICVEIISVKSIIRNSQHITTRVHI